MKNIIAYLIASICFCVTIFAQETKTNLYADNIIIVFDASGSMDASIGKGDNSNKLLVAKFALRQVISKLNDNTNIGLFVFGNGDANPVPIGPKNVDNLNKAIDKIKAGGGTPLGEFIESAANHLLQQRQKNLGYGRYKIIVVTDGEATDGGRLNRVAPEVLRRNLSLDVIGVGMTSEHQLAKMSTSYRAANDKLALNKALQEIIAETPTKAGDIDDNDFNIIKGLDSDQAKSIILTLGNTENQPLFQNPVVVDTSANASISAQPSAPPALPSNPFPAALFILVPLVIIILIIIVSTILN